MSKFRIRAATQNEFSIAVDWAAREGWNPGLEDLPAFHAADPQGFLMGYLDDRPVSSISVVRYGQDFGFLGFYIVLPEYRGQGYGFQIWQAGLQHLAGRVVGLDGVVAQQENYRKSGFVLAGRNVRYTGTIEALSNYPAQDTQPITHATRLDVTEYDRRFFADDRTAFMMQWMQSADPGRRWGVLSKTKDGLQGFGVIRACKQGYKVGPLFAESRDVAEAILAGLCERLPVDSKITIDVPEDNQAAGQMVHALGFEANFETARMYKGSAPGLPINKTFGITTFELG